MEIIKKPPSRRYFFAYHNYHGQVWPFMWAEEEGVTVGGRPAELINGKKFEITLEEFEGTIRELEEKYPVELPPTDST